MQCARSEAARDRVDIRPTERSLEPLLDDDAAAAAAVKQLLLVGSPTLPYCRLHNEQVDK